MTMEIPAVQSERKRRRQMRAFTLIWAGLTLVLGLATFVAIFLASGLLLPESSGQVVVSAAEISQPTALPTRIVAATPIPQLAQAQPTSTPAVVAQVPTVTATEPPEPTPEPTLPFIERTDFDFGIQVQESYDIYEYWMTVVKDQLHMDWIKHQTRWEVMEPQKGNIDWTILDIVIPEAHKKGVNVMLSIVTAPDWARQPGADLSKHGPPANPQDYVNFVTAILNRYLDEYPGTIGAIEVWNEMNLDREWASVNGLSSREYITLLAATYNAIKAIDPGIIVISGALSPGGGWTEPDGRVSAIDDFTYLDALLNNGMLNYADCVGAHHNGYNIGPLVAWDVAPREPEARTARFRGPFDNPHHSWSMYSTLTTYANKIQLAGGNQRLCVTEFGWAVSEDLGGYPRGFEFAQDNTLQEQAEYFIEAVQWFEESGIIWLAWIWNLNYGAQAGFDPSNDNVPYSILRPDSKPAPAWDAIAQYRLERFGP
ncbi:MAG: hypothetical protein HPY64_03515 [Anaerolineae bacterium]|nr:hypothetical protein [Anaerolineae bacterium]